MACTEDYLAHSDKSVLLISRGTFFLFINSTILRIIFLIKIYGLGSDVMIFFKLSISYFFWASSKISHKKKKETLKNSKANPGYYYAKSAQVLNNILGDLRSSKMDIFLSHYIQSESLNFFPDVSNS